MRPLRQLNIKSLKILCLQLNCTERELEDFHDHNERWYRHGTIVDKHGKERPIDVPIGRFFQVLHNLQVLLSRVFLPSQLQGGVKGHSPKTNAACHVGKHAVLRFDLQDFFPRIRPRQVHSMFQSDLGCSPRVASVLTRMVTYDGGLPQGSPTSTAVANLVIIPLVKRLKNLALQHECDYTQFVDDGTISGPAYIERLRPLIERIIRQEGFRASPKASKRLTLYWYDEQVVTGVKVNKRIDVPVATANSVSALLNNLADAISRGEDVSPQQLRSLAGKIQYVKSLNRRIGQSFHRRFLKLRSRCSAA